MCSTDNQGGLFSEPGKPPKLTSYFRVVPCLPLPGSLWLFFPPVPSWWREALAGPLRPLTSCVTLAWSHSGSEPQSPRGSWTEWSQGLSSGPPSARQTACLVGCVWLVNPVVSPPLSPLPSPLPWAGVCKASPGLGSSLSVSF